MATHACAHRRIMLPMKHVSSGQPRISDGTETNKRLSPPRRLFTAGSSLCDAGTCRPAIWGAAVDHSAGVTMHQAAARAAAAEGMYWSMGVFDSGALELTRECIVLATLCAYRLYSNAPSFSVSPTLALCASRTWREHCCEMMRPRDCCARVYVHDCLYMSMLSPG